MMKIEPVTGKGNVSAAPDTARLSCGVNTLAKTADEALNRNNNLMKTVIQDFKNINSEDKNIQISGFNVYPLYDYSRDS